MFEECRTFHSLVKGWTIAPEAVAAAATIMHDITPTSNDIDDANDPTPTTTNTPFLFQSRTF